MDCYKSGCCYTEVHLYVALEILTSDGYSFFSRRIFYSVGVVSVSGLCTNIKSVQFLRCFVKQDLAQVENGGISISLRWIYMHNLSSCSYYETIKSVTNVI